MTDTSTGSFPAPPPLRVLDSVRPWVSDPRRLPGPMSPEINLYCVTEVLLWCLILQTCVTLCSDLKILTNDRVYGNAFIEKRISEGLCALRGL